MSRSQHERGDFIREKIGNQILHDLGRGEITAEEAGDIDDLLQDLDAAGTTPNLDLAKHPYYKQAIEAWKKYLADRKKQFAESRRM